MNSRKVLVEKFLCRTAWHNANRVHLAGDASNRRYERLELGCARAVLMDAPDSDESVCTFIVIANLLRSLGLSAPEIIEANISDGLLLLEDYGDTTYTERISAGVEEVKLYGLAVDVLIHLHRSYKDNKTIPPYDDDLLLKEAGLCINWYMPAVLSIKPFDQVKLAYSAAWKSVFNILHDVPTSLVLRDFHADNLMLLNDRPGVAACGLLDFQDAVVGPVSYDLVSLLEDARRHVSPNIADQMLSKYLDAFPRISREKFMCSYAVLGAQRCAKILGIFTRLDRRDGKPQYLRHISRVWRWLENDLNHPALAPVKDWFDEYLPLKYRITPSPMTRE